MNPNKPITEAAVKESIDQLFDEKQPLSQRQRQFWRTFVSIMRRGLDHSQGNPVRRLLKYYNRTQQAFRKRQYKSQSCSCWGWHSHKKWG